MSTAPRHEHRPHIGPTERCSCGWEGKSWMGHRGALSRRRGDLDADLRAELPVRSADIADRLADLIAQTEDQPIEVFAAALVEILNLRAEKAKTARWVSQMLADLTHHDQWESSAPDIRTEKGWCSVAERVYELTEDGES